MEEWHRQRVRQRQQFPIFSDLHAVLGGRAMVSLFHVLDSASGSTQSPGAQQDDDDVERPESLTSPISSLDTPGSLTDRTEPEPSGPINSLDMGVPSTRPNTLATFTGRLKHTCHFHQQVYHTSHFHHQA